VTTYVAPEGSLHVVYTATPPSGEGVECARETNSVRVLGSDACGGVVATASPAFCMAMWLVHFSMHGNQWQQLEGLVLLCMWIELNKIQ